MPPTANGNDTCTENNCGWVEQGKPPNPKTCENATLANVWSCPSGVCSTLFHSLIAPFANMTIAAAIFYQGRFPCDAAPTHKIHAHLTTPIPPPPPPPLT